MFGLKAATIEQPTKQEVRSAVRAAAKMYESGQVSRSWFRSVASSAMAWEITRSIEKKSAWKSGKFFTKISS